MRILFLPKHEYLGASSRYRTLQYLSYVQDVGITFDVKPLFSDEYLLYKYQYGKENKIITLQRILKRIVLVLFHGAKYDVLVIEKELVPYFPPILEWYLKLRNISYIVDYDDAVWHNYDEHKVKIVQTMLKNKIRTVMKYSSVVLAGSEYILEYAKYASAKNIVKIPTVVDTTKYMGQSPQRENEQFIIGWIGSPSTSKYILHIDSMLTKFTSQYNAIVHLVGFDKKMTDKLTCNYCVIEWKESSEVDEICKFDVGIMPLIDSPFERGKCGFKLIQYMACKKPVIASPIGENKIIVEEGVNGYLASDEDDWFVILEKLYHSQNMRVEMGMVGYEKIQKYYSLQAMQEKYFKVIVNHE